eukprot:TRINITY_DN46936_c0_g1_i1.p1 TRINITY_DN46936_c0_g1~~TRINITY_DN46936_c0_g1_i1.p1  ORF type:complete len:548 (+),score=127.86 TRINITY_DN46936_c0_g1_i1:133-1776(+)
MESDVSPLFGGEPELELLLDRVRFFGQRALASDCSSSAAGSSCRRRCSNGDRGSGKNALARLWRPVLTALEFVWPLSPQSALRRAVCESDIASAHELLRSRADPCGRCGEATAFAVIQEHWTLLSLLVDFGGHIDSRWRFRYGRGADAADDAAALAFELALGPAPLLRRLWARDDAGLELMLRAGAGARAEAPDERERRAGTTPLLWALALGSLRSARTLMRYGANVRARDRHGVGAAAIAAFSGNVELLEFVIVARAEVNVADARRQVPLYVACAAGHDAAARFLLCAGADPQLLAEGACVEAATPEGDFASAVLQRALRDVTMGAEASLAPSALRVEVLELSGRQRARLEVLSEETVESLVARLAIPACTSAKLLLKTPPSCITDEPLATLAAAGVTDGAQLTLVLSAEPAWRQLCGRWRFEQSTYCGFSYHDKHETYVFHPDGDVEYEAVDNFDDGESPESTVVRGRGTWRLDESANEEREHDVPAAGEPPTVETKAADDPVIVVECVAAERMESSGYFSVSRTEDHCLSMSQEWFLKNFKRMK